VHAREQKFTLRLDLLFSQARLFSLLKKALRKYVLVKKVEKVDDGFHPICQVFNKEYRYFINVGQHNFFNYAYCRWKEREKVNTEREINSLKTIIGEVISCYEGKQTVNDLKEKLLKFNQANYKYKNIAPAAGLYLSKIDYVEGRFFSYFLDNDMSFLVILLRLSLISIIPVSTACWQISLREPKKRYSLLIKSPLITKPIYTKPTGLFSWVAGPALPVKLMAKSVP
ncbi:4742_t:CDS:2, partial [Funneliformis geosporum]